MHADTEYALLLSQIDVTRVVVSARDALTATNALIQLTIAADECMRHAYIRTWLAQQNEASASLRPHLQCLGQPGEKREGDEDDTAVQLTVDYSCQVH